MCPSALYPPERCAPVQGPKVPCAATRSGRRISVHMCCKPCPAPPSGRSCSPAAHHPHAATSMSRQGGEANEDRPRGGSTESRIAAGVASLAPARLPGAARAGSTGAESHGTQPPPGLESAVSGGFSQAPAAAAVDEWSQRVRCVPAPWLGAPAGEPAGRHGLPRATGAEGTGARGSGPATTGSPAVGRGSSGTCPGTPGSQRRTVGWRMAIPARP